MSLLDKKCTPCQGEVPSLNEAQVEILLKEIEYGWQINNLGHLYKRHLFKNFMEAMNFANKIAKISEKENHHPDLTIRWGSCGVEIWTHKVNGLTENDFILAGKIGAII